jgi:hypothetical protein
LYLAIRANLGGGEVDLFSIDSGYKLLLADLIGFGPVFILAFHDTALLNDPLHFINDGL